MREQSRLHVQITLKERAPDVLMFGFFFLFWPLCKKNQSLRSKDSKGSRCVTGNKYSQKKSKTEDFKVRRFLRWLWRTL